MSKVLPWCLPGCGISVTNMQTVTGTCHCGVVEFEVDSDFEEFTTCDCSICVMRNAVMVKVPEANLRILSGKDNLTLYQWNMKIAKHYFCKTCGIYMFHNKRAAPSHFGVNVYCLQYTEKDSIPIRATEGDNMTISKKESKPHWPGPRV